ncbi:MAG: hypothetical protein CMP93_00700, partial [Gammaproteobacteria bacterium]|nr:hypothetical protein [Gammaproteobacteria bacterium]
MSLETIRLGELALSEESLLLDVGAGEGRHSISAHLISDAMIFGLDANHEDLQTARSRLKIMASEIRWALMLCLPSPAPTYC